MPWSSISLEQRRAQGVRAILGQSEEEKYRKQCHPVQCADAGSIEKRGIELALTLATRIAVMIWCVFRPIVTAHFG